MAMIEESVTQDAAASVETAYTMSVGDGFEGVLSTRSDRDWVAVELVAGRSYDIRLEGIGAGGVTDTMLKVYNAAGKEVASNDDIEWEALELSSMLGFTPDESGVYYLSAAAVPLRDLDNTGAYRLTLTDEEDNTADTPHVVAVGGAFRGTLADKYDEDWVRVDLAQGKTYDITLRGIGADADTDTLLTIYDAAGEQLARNDDVDYEGGRTDSALTFTPDASGAYYLSAGAYSASPAQGNAGRYQVAVHEVGVNYGKTLTGTESSEYYHTRLTGSIGDDTLNGNGGWDWLEGGPGADRMTGGSGTDTVSYQYSGAGVEVRLYDGTAKGGDAEGDTFTGKQTVGQAEAPDVEDLFGSAYDDVLAGAAGPNWLSGYYGDDRLDGRAGDDWLDGGGGADALRGGRGNDAALYIYSPEGVEVRLHDGTAKGGYAEGDTFPGRQAVEYTDSEGVTRTLDELDVEDLFGSFHDDILAGNHRSNRLRGLDGNDVLEGRQGHDVLDGGAGNDRLEGGLGADALTGGPGADTASYQSSPAGVEVRLHSGKVQGGHAAGDTFPETVAFAWTDADGQTQRLQVPDVEHLHGSAHNDVLAGDGRNNVLSGDAGNDTLYGGPLGGDDLLRGGSGNDKLYGGQGADTLQGGRGADALRGGPGNDRLHGDDGNDRLHGGDGADTFVLDIGGGNDTILDFGTGGDRIDLAAFTAIRSTDDLTLTQRGDNLVIDLSAQRGGVVTLQDVDRADLTDAHFIFHADDPAIA